jgi:hypothetical protein
MSNGKVFIIKFSQISAIDEICRHILNLYSQPKASYINAVDWLEEVERKLTQINTQPQQLPQLNLEEEHSPQPRSRSNSRSNSRERSRSRSKSRGSRSRSHSRETSRGRRKGRSRSRSSSRSQSPNHKSRKG